MKEKPTLYKFWLVIDGIGLGIILVCTIFEGLEEWDETYSLKFHDNISATVFWCSGISNAIMGLLLLIINAASFESIPRFEYIGMTLLTIAPLFNMIACVLSTFSKTADDESLIDNKRWVVSEMMELIGMLLLDLSYREELFGELGMLIVEIIGFIVLSCAAVLECQFDSVSDMTPAFVLRIDHIRGSDCFGLFLLILVAIGKYQIWLTSSDFHQHSQQSYSTLSTYEDDTISSINIQSSTLTNSVVLELTSIAGSGTNGGSNSLRVVPLSILPGNSIISSHTENNASKQIMSRFESVISASEHDD